MLPRVHDERSTGPDTEIVSDDSQRLEAIGGPRFLSFRQIRSILPALMTDPAEVDHLPVVATTAQQLQQAWRLVQACYVQKGYARADGVLWYDHSPLDPRTTTLLMDGGHPATLTVVFDSPLRLPSDAVFKEELDALRLAGRQLCEFTALAHANPDQDLDIQTVYELFRHAWLTAAHLESATDILITVNPRHVPFYRRALLFERLGPVRNFDKVSGAPAVLMRLDLSDAEARFREHRLSEIGNFFLEDPHLGAVLARLYHLRHAPDPWVLAHFLHQRRNLIDGLDPACRSWVMRQNPGLAELMIAPASVRQGAQLLAV